VDDVSFSVERGEIVALLGPNGSGKSTLMRCLIGFFAPSRGAVRVGGVDVAVQAIEARKRIGYLPEQVSLYPELSVRRYLEFVAGVKGIGRRGRPAAVDAVIAECRLSSVAQRAAGTLSKGFRQRVGIAQALLGQPDLLVFDEPTVGLDPIQTVELRSLIQSLRGRTVLLSTHILSEAATLCSRVAILKQGRLLAVDTPGELARRIEGVSAIVVRAIGPGEELRTAVARLPEVSGVATALPQGGGEIALRVAAADPMRAPGAIAAAILAAGGTLLEVRPEAPSLEDLFMRVVA
jgi:ABC-2 type transport system ATP-binding protein